MTAPQSPQGTPPEPGLRDELVAQIGHVAWRTLGGYALVVTLGFAALSFLSLRRSLQQTGDVIESLLGLYADPSGERTAVAPDMLSEQLTGMGSRFVITRRTNDPEGRPRTYFLTPDMPAKEILGIAAEGGPEAVQRVILESAATRGWRYQVVHRSSGDFDIFIAGDRTIYLGAIVGVALAALLLLPVGAAVARRSTRRVVVAGLRPVESVRRGIAALGPDDLSQRLAVPTGLQETTEVAEAVNRMLGRVEAAQRQLATFTGDASHELRTPITFLRAQSQWALDGTRTRDELVSAMASVNAEADRMHRIVEGLLLLARGDNERLPSQRAPFDLAAVVTEVAEIGDGMASTRGLTVELRMPDEVRRHFRAVGDQEHTRLILLNLVSNAVRFTERGGIRIAAFAEGTEVRVDVEDDGIGIAPVELQRIFDRFVRLEESRSRELGGAGLGLSIARMLARVQGGTLSAESVQGVGSRFSLRLAAATDHADATSSSRDAT